MIYKCYFEVVGGLKGYVIFWESQFSLFDRFKLMVV